MDLDILREERRKWLTWKNIAPYQEAIQNLPSSNEAEVSLGNTVEIKIPNLTSEVLAQIEKTARLMKPWRKGPFQINTLFIDTEWKSNIKYNLLEPYFTLEDKIVGDIG